MLDQVAQAELFRINAARTPNLPLIVLNQVTDCSVYRTRSVPDSQIEDAARKEL